MKIVEATGGRLVMDDGNVSESSVGVELCEDPIHIERLHPILLQHFVRDSILACDLRNSLLHRPAFAPHTGA